MEFSAKDLAGLLNAICHTLSDRSELERLARLQLDIHLNVIVGNEVGLEKAAYELISHCQKNERLVKLIEAVSAAYPNNPCFSELKNRRRSSLSQTSADDPFLELFPKQCSFVNRSCLREHLRSTSSDVSSRIIRILGDSNYGKSHSINLISHVCESANPKAGLVVLNLWNPGQTVDAQHLANKLSAQMRFTDLIAERIDGPQAPKLSAYYIDKFAGRMREQQGNWWIVIDGLHKVPLDQSAYEFIYELAHITQHTLTNVRLILIGYQNNLPDVQPLDETINNPSLAEIEEFFLLALRQAKLTCSPQRVATAASSVWSTCTSELGGLRKLSTLVSQEFKKLTRECS